MPLSDVFGLDGPVRALRRAIAEDRLAGTYLFVGAEGVGKTALAMAFADAACCLSPASDPFDACGRCDSCVRAARGRQPEIVRVEPAGDQMQIWQFWDRDGRPPGVLQHTLQYAPVIGRRRVYVIERADALNEAAANSLLKVLEEPPPYALFVLLSPNPARMLPTILSRAQLVRLAPSPVDALARYLVDLHGIDEARARRCAAHAEGHTGRAVSLATDETVQQGIVRVLDLAEAMPVAPALSALQFGERIRQLATTLKVIAAPAQEPAAEVGADAPAPEAKERASRKQVGALLDLMSAVYRDMLALRLSGEGASILHVDRRAGLAAAAGTRPPEHWMRCLEDLIQARRRVDQNASLPILTDWLAIRLTGPG